jgi:hypothetical protein
MAVVSQISNFSQPASVTNDPAASTSSAQLQADVATFFNLYNSGNANGAADFITETVGSSNVSSADTQSFQYQLLMQISLGFAEQDYAKMVLPSELSNLKIS